jgi:hypothetical protein
MKKCKNCKGEFVPINFNQKYCFSTECLKIWITIAKDKEWNKTKFKLKNSLKTNQQLMKLAQVHFNKFIRFRDKGENCISCNKEAKKENAGHYYSQGGHSAVRFNEDNVHLQCEHCNTYLSGNLLNYQIGIQKRIGGERLIELQSKAHLEKKWSKDELNEIIKIYKNKVKNVIY